MLLWLLLKFQTQLPPLRVLRYVSFRVIAAMLCAPASNTPCVRPLGLLGMGSVTRAGLRAYCCARSCAMACPISKTMLPVRASR